MFRVRDLILLRNTDGAVHNLESKFSSSRKLYFSYYDTLPLVCSSHPAATLLLNFLETSTLATCSLLVRTSVRN